MAGTFDNVRTLITDRDLEKQDYLTLTKVQQERVTRITVGYKAGSSTVAYRIIPKCKGWQRRVNAAKAHLKAEGRKGIWTNEWKAAR